MHKEMKPMSKYWKTRKKLRKSKRIPAALALMLCVAGCANTGVSDYCLLTQPIYLYESDIACISDGLAYDILLRNEQWKALCE